MKKIRKHTARTIGLSIAACLFFVSCRNYRVLDKAAVKYDADMLATPNVSCGFIKNALKAANSDIRIKAGTSLPLFTGPAGGLSKSTFFDFEAKKRFLSHKYNLFITVHYNTLIKPGTGIDEQQVGAFIDELRANLDQLDNGARLNGSASAFMLKAGQRSYDVLNEIFSHVPLPVNMGLARYSWRADQNETYVDILPEMELKIQRAPLNSKDTGTLTSVDYINVSRSTDILILSTFYPRFSRMMIAADPNGPRSSALTIDFHSTDQAGPLTNSNAKYLGLLYHTQYRANGPMSVVRPCPCFNNTYPCNALLIRDIDFASYKANYMPAWSGTILTAAPAGPVNPAHCLLYSDQTDERTGVVPYLFVFYASPVTRQLAEMGTTFEQYKQGFPPNYAARLSRLYNGRYRTVKGHNGDVLLNINDLIQ